MFCMMCFSSLLETNEQVTVFLCSHKENFSDDSSLWWISNHKIHGISFYYNDLKITNVAMALRGEK